MANREGLLPTKAITKAPASASNGGGGGATVSYSERRIPEWLFLVGMMFAGFAFGRLFDLHNNNDAQQEHNKKEAQAIAPVEQEQWIDRMPEAQHPEGGGIGSPSPLFEIQSDYRQCSLNQPYPRPQHGCTVNTDSHMVYCQMQDLVVDPSKIKSKSVGGEELKDVMGQPEENEILTYEAGAFSTKTEMNIPDDIERDYMYYVSDVLQSRVVDPNPGVCEETSDRLTLFITRYEYVDFFHASRDFFNAFLSLPEPDAKADVVFLDAHPRGHLDELWNILLGGTIRHVRQLKGTACYSNAMLIPPGYSSVLWPRDRWFQSKKCPSMVDTFVNVAMKRAGLEKVQQQRGRVLVVDRKAWIAHPRSSLNNHDREVDNLDVLVQKIQLNVTDLTEVKLLTLEQMPIVRQMEEVRKAHIMIGTHPTELALLLFLGPQASLIELAPTTAIDDLIMWKQNVTHEPVTIYRMPVTDHLDEDTMDNFMIPMINHLMNPTTYRKPGQDHNDGIVDMEEDEMDLDMEDDRFGDQWNLGQGDDQFDEPAFNSMVRDNETNYQKCTINRPNPRPSNGCQADGDTAVPFCIFTNFSVDPTKITMTAKGGEPLSAVMGRNEDDEYPLYSIGAFTVNPAPHIPPDINTDLFYHLNDILKATVPDENQQCRHLVKGLTLFATRYEYVNLYHTMKDWFNAFLTLPTQAVRPTSVVFLDGHAEGNLDPVWSQLYGNVTFVKHLPDDGLTCFEQAAVVPPGYSSVLWPVPTRFMDSLPCPSMMSEFVNFTLDAYGLRDLQMIRGKVTIIDRVPYVSHPRSDGRTIERRIDNLGALADRIKQETAATAVDLVRLETMTFEEQLKAIRQTHVLIGNHGAGLSLSFFLTDEASVGHLSGFGNLMMEEMGKWKPTITIVGLVGGTDNIIMDVDMIGILDFVRNVVGEN